MIGGKVCPRCPERGVQPASAFWRSSERADGLQVYCKECRRATQREYVADGRSAGWKRQHRDRLRTEMFEAYGHTCACCGESEKRFLTLDHIDGLPDEHRVKRSRSGRRTTTSILGMLRRAGWPSGYQILCWNCNCARAIYGTCPHRESVREVA